VGYTVDEEEGLNAEEEPAGEDEGIVAERGRQGGLRHEEEEKAGIGSREGGGGDPVALGEGGGEVEGGEGGGEGFGEGEAKQGTERSLQPGAGEGRGGEGVEEEDGGGDVGDPGKGEEEGKKQDGSARGWVGGGFGVVG
jgi:hypothetical protein